jgi:preprotein translocase subunit SecE
MAEAAKERTNWAIATREYLNDLKLEMRRVTWPNRKQVETTTAVVIFTVFAFAAYFRLVDLLLDNSLIKVYNLFTK